MKPQPTTDRRWIRNRLLLAAAAVVVIAVSLYSIRDFIAGVYWWSFGS